MEQRSTWLDLTNRNGRLLTRLMVNAPPNHNSLKDYSLHQINNGDNHRLNISCTELIKWKGGGGGGGGGGNQP